MMTKIISNVIPSIINDEKYPIHAVLVSDEISNGATYIWREQRDDQWRLSAYRFGGTKVYLNSREYKSIIMFIK